MNSKILKSQILLLKLYAGYRELDHALASYRPLYQSLNTNPVLHAERGRKHAQYELAQLYRRIEYLQHCHFVELVIEGEKRLLKLTSKGKYEILRMRFVEHMMVQKKKAWDRKWRIAFFDIPESKKKYRNFFRRLLKQNEFKMIQRSVWMTPYNPQPHLDELLKYLGLEKHFEIMEAECEKCSKGFLKKFKL